MSDEFIKWIGIIGSVASLVGLYYAIKQINKTLEAAEAAKEAALKTRKVISRNLLLSDVSTCTRIIEEIKLFVRSEKYEPALIRVTDLVSQLIQIQEVSKSSSQTLQVNFKEKLSQLSVIRKSFEKKIAKTPVKIYSVAVISQLAEISDDLNKFIGENKIVIEENN